jgi:hypothetical protein
MHAASVAPHVALNKQTAAMMYFVSIQKEFISPFDRLDRAEA